MHLHVAASDRHREALLSFQGGWGGCCGEGAEVGEGESGPFFRNRAGKGHEPAGVQTVLPKLAIERIDEEVAF